MLRAIAALLRWITRPRGPMRMPGTRRRSSLDRVVKAEIDEAVVRAAGNRIHF